MKILENGKWIEYNRKCIKCGRTSGPPPYFEDREPEQADPNGCDYCRWRN